MEIKSPFKQYKFSDPLVHNCQYYAIFCPVYRRPVLVDGIEKRLKELTLEKQEEYGYGIMDKILDMEIIPYHVSITGF